MKIIRTKPGSKGQAVADQVKVPWRLVTVDRDAWVVDNDAQLLLAQSIPDPAGAPNVSIEVTRTDTGMISRVYGEDFRVPLGLLDCTSGDVVAKALCFINANKSMLGLTSPSQEITLNNQVASDYNRSLVLFNQLFQGYPVLQRRLIVTVSAAEEVVGVNSTLATPITGPTPAQLQATFASFDSSSGIASLRSLLGRNSLVVLNETERIWPVRQGAGYVAVPVIAIEAGTPSTGAEVLGIIDVDTHEVLFHHPLIFDAPPAQIWGSAVLPDMTATSPHPACDSSPCAETSQDCSANFEPEACVQHCSNPGDCAHLGYGCFDPNDPANSHFGGYCYSGSSGGLPTDPFLAYNRAAGDPAPMPVWYNPVLETDPVLQHAAASLEEVITHHSQDMEIDGWDSMGGVYTMYLVSQCFCSSQEQCVEYQGIPGFSCARPRANGDSVIFPQGPGWFGDANPTPLQAWNTDNTVGHEWGHVLHGSVDNGMYPQATVSHCLSEGLAIAFGALFTARKYGPTFSSEWCGTELDEWGDENSGLTTVSCLEGSRNIPYAHRSRFDWNECNQTYLEWGDQCQTNGDCPSYHVCRLPPEETEKRCSSMASRYNAKTTLTRLAKIMAEGPSAFADDGHNEDIGIIDRPLGLALTSKIFHRASSVSLMDLKYWVDQLKDWALTFTAENPDAYSATVDALGASGFFPRQTQVTGYQTDRTPVRIEFDRWVWSDNKTFVIWKQHQTGNIKVQYYWYDQPTTITIPADADSDPEVVVAGSVGTFLFVYFRERNTNILKAWYIHSLGFTSGTPYEMGPGFRTNGKVTATVWQDRLYLFFSDLDNGHKLTMAWAPVDDQHAISWNIFSNGTPKKVIYDEPTLPGASAVGATSVNGLSLSNNSLFVAAAKAWGGRLFVTRIDTNDNVADVFWMPEHYPSYKTYYPVGLTVRASAFPRALWINPPDPPMLLPRNYLYLIWKDRDSRDIYTSVLQNASSADPWFTRSTPTMYQSDSHVGVSWAKGLEPNENVRALYVPANGPSNTIYQIHGYGKY